MLDNQNQAPNDGGGITVDLEGNDKIQKRWDGMADYYETMAEAVTVQGFIQCAVNSLASKPDRILEVASGPGWHSMMIAESFMEKGSVLVSSDISGVMVTKMEKHFQSDESDYGQVQGNKFLAEKENDYTLMENDGKKLKHTCDLEGIVKSQEPYRKLVYGCQANVEMLPFPDQSFGGYVANLSLQLVNNHKNQLKEAYRVLKPGSIATFSIWGRREETLQFSLVDKVLEKYAPPEKMKAYYAQKSNFNLYDDGGVAVKKDVLEAGFSNIKMWTTPIPFTHRDSQHYMERIGAKQLEQKLINFDMMNDEMYQTISKELIETFENLSGKNTTDIKTMEVAIIVAFKDN